MNDNTERTIIVLEQEITELKANIEFLNALIDAQKEFEKKDSTRLKRLDAWTDTQRNIINHYTKLLRGIQVKLAVQNLVQNTHRERNDENLRIVRDIHAALHNTVEFYTNYKQDIDDIPF